MQLAARSLLATTLLLGCAASIPRGNAATTPPGTAATETTPTQPAVPAPRVFEPLTVFDLEWASDPQVSPDGTRVAYVRNFMDVMKDRKRSNVWIVNRDGSGHRPLTTGTSNDRAPRWSPDGSRLLYVSSAGDKAQLFVRWLDTGQTAQVTHLTEGPGGLAWSPDGKLIAFSMRVPAKSEPMAKMPEKPEGAEWADPPKVIRQLSYRADGEGYLKDGFTHVFVVPSEGGTPRQLTTGSFHHGDTPSWTPDGKALVFSANRHEDGEYDPVNTEVYEVRLDDGAITALTDRKGPDASPVVSPDGKLIAYTGFDDRFQGYQVDVLHVMDRDGKNARAVSAAFDRDVNSPRWSADGRSIVFSYDAWGETKLGSITLDGQVTTLAGNVGGTSLGRPYPGGSFTVARDGTIAFTRCGPDRPADVAVLSRRGADAKVVTSLNEDSLGHLKLGAVEELWLPSSHDGRQIQCWLVKPPSFQLGTKYPLILEIHGGPFLNYGPRFAAELQLYAAAGYVVLYVNPRGSTGYGEEFGNLIHHAYPGHDYDDLMSAVGTVLQKGWVDPTRLFVTGGSGGGVLTAWIVGKTDRFRAAVVQKPVVNWYSFALTSDGYNYFYKYWFPAPPWEKPEAYIARSPLSLVGNVKTPTMLLTGEVDYRTPMSESEQYYQALKLLRVETALVRVPGASHDLEGRPSVLIAKVAHVLAWFGEHGGVEMDKKAEGP